MKKVLVIFAASLFLFIGCGKKEEPKTTEKTTTQEVQQGMKEMGKKILAL